MTLIFDDRPALSNYAKRRALDFFPFVDGDPMTLVSEYRPALLPYAAAPLLVVPSAARRERVVSSSLQTVAENLADLVRPLLPAGYCPSSPLSARLTELDISVLDNVLHIPPEGGPRKNFLLWRCAVCRVEFVNRIRKKGVWRSCKG